MACSLGSTNQNQRADSALIRRDYVSQSCQWDEFHDIFVMLWPGTPLAELMKIMEYCYGFRATKDQYKKKFKFWYEKNMLPPKKQKRGELAREKPKELEDCAGTQEAVIRRCNGLPTPVSSPQHDENIESIEYGIPPNSGSAVLLKDTGSQTDMSHIGEIETGFKRRSSVLGTEPQNEYHRLLSELWDTYFDAEFGHTDFVDVGEAVRNMVDFLLDIAVTDPDLSSITTHQGDIELLNVFATKVRCSCIVDKHISRDLDAITSVIPLYCQASEDEPYPYHDVKQLQGTSAISRYSHVVVYCCYCGDGPYNQKVSVGCAMPHCAGHRFCSGCTVEP